MENNHPFLQKTHIPNPSNDANIASACIRTSNDILKILAKAIVKPLADYLPFLKAPITVLNAFVQALVVIFDKNCPRHARNLTLLSLAGIVTGAISIAIFFPTSITASFGLTLFTHIARLSYRVERYSRALKKYNQLKRQSNEKSLIAERLALFTLWQKMTRNTDSTKQRTEEIEGFNQALILYLQACTPQALKLKRQRYIVNKAILSCSLMTLRGVASLFLVAFALTTPSLVMPLTLVIFTINTIDLARTLDNKRAQIKEARYIDREKEKLCLNFSLGRC